MTIKCLRKGNVLHSHFLYFALTYMSWKGSRYWPWNQWPVWASAEGLLYLRRVNGMDPKRKRKKPHGQRMIPRQRRREKYGVLASKQNSHTLRRINLHWRRRHSSNVGRRKLPKGMRFLLRAKGTGEWCNRVTFISDEYVFMRHNEV